MLSVQFAKLKFKARVLEILSGIQDQVTKLKELSETMKLLDSRISSLETQTGKLTDTPESPKISRSISNEAQKENNELELRDQ
jgi:hypothetical protein